MALREEMGRSAVSVVIARRSCMLNRNIDPGVQAPLFVKESECVGCKACLKIGCPAIEWQPADGDGARGVAKVDRLLCTGCGICEQLCKFEAFGVCND